MCFFDGRESLHDCGLSQLPFLPAQASAGRCKLVMKGSASAGVALSAGPKEVAIRIRFWDVPVMVCATLLFVSPSEEGGSMRNLGGKRLPAPQEPLRSPLQPH